MNLRRGAWYATGIAATAAITLAIVAVERVVNVPNLSVLYVLLVLAIGWRAGRWPAVVTSVVAFVAYDFFVVPPVGTLNVAGPGQLLELLVLLAAALVTGQLAASLDRSRGEANAAAAEARALYGLAVDVLRRPELATALELVCGRGTAVDGVLGFAVVPLPGGAAGEPVGHVRRPDDVREAERAFARGAPLGCSLRDGVLTLLRSQPPRSEELAVLPLTSGALVMRTDPDRVGLDARRLLAALAALAELLLERQRAAAEADRRHELEVSDSLKAAVLSSLSHELKSPLASLRTGLTALAGNGLPPEQRELLLGLDRQAVRLDRLVDDLLTMSRLESGSAPRLEAIPFAETAGAVLHRLAARFEGRRLDVQLPPDLPAISADELQLERVLTNLLENAAGWTEPGGRIELGARAGESRLTVWVANDGPPIPPAELPSIFDKFWTKRPDGSGLGLAICRRIVEAHGGAIEARNRRDGPEFRFTWPLAEVEAR